MAQQPIVLIDASNVLQRAYYSALIFDPKADADKVLRHAQSMILKYLRDLRSDTRHAMLCAEAGKSWRSELLPTYKDGRKEKTPILSEVLKRGPQYLADAIKIKSTAVEGYEADDVIATYADILAAEYYDAVIVSGDKDLFQCVSTTTKLCLLRQQGGPAMYGPIEFRTEYGFSAPNIADFKALTGDKSDAIPGVDGIGETFARRLLMMYGDLRAIYAAAHMCAEGLVGYNDAMTARVHRLLGMGEEIAWRNLKLITLDKNVPGVELRSSREHRNAGSPAPVAQADEERSHQGDEPVRGDGDMEAGGRP